MTAQMTVEPAATESTRTGRVYRPLVDILERADELLIVADLPGASAESIDVRFENGELSIHARVAPRPGREVAYVRQEYGVGDFQRVFQVSETVDGNRITASYDQGVLTLHLPKVEAAMPRKIDVRSGR